MQILSFQETSEHTTPRSSSSPLIEVELGNLPGGRVHLFSTPATSDDVTETTSNEAEITTTTIGQLFFFLWRSFSIKSSICPHFLLLVQFTLLILLFQFQYRQRPLGALEGTREYTLFLILILKRKSTKIFWWIIFLIFLSGE